MVLKKCGFFVGFVQYCMPARCWPDAGPDAGPDASQMAPGAEIYQFAWNPQFGSVRFGSGPVRFQFRRFGFIDFLMCFFVFFEILYVFSGFLHGQNDPQILRILSLFYVDFFST